MKRINEKIVLIVIFAVLFIYFSVSAYAIDVNFNSEKELLNSAVRGEVLDDIEEYEINVFNNNFSIKKIWVLIKSKIVFYYKQPFSILISLIAIIILASITKQFNESISSNKIADILIVLSITLIIIEPIIERIKACIVTINDYRYFSATFIPVFAGVLTASGQPITAGSFNIFLFTVVSVYTQIVTDFFIPFIYAFVTLSIVSVINTDMKLTKLIKAVKNLIVWVLTLSLTILIGLLSLQTAISSSNDGVAVKTTKFIMGSLIPGLGSTLSDLFMASQGFIHIIKNFVGAYGILLTAIIFLPEIVNLFLWYTMLNTASFVAGIFGIDQIDELCKNFATVFGLILSVILYIMFLIIIATTLILVCFKGV